MALILAGCEHSPVKPTADLKRIQEIDHLIEELRVAYENRDFPAFARLYPAEPPEEIRAISSILDRINDPRMDFLIDRIILEGEAVRVALHWELQWQSDAPQPIKQRGNSLFHLNGKTLPRLQAIDGDNPFIAPKGIGNF